MIIVINIYLKFEQKIFYVMWHFKFENEENP